jgi:hypothetical protein
MSSHSGHFQASAGYNEQGGAYYIVISSIVDQINTYTPGSGSGGGTTVGAFSPFTYGATNTSSTYAVGNTIKDMGKTVVSSGRTFRKFQGVGPQIQSTNGVAGLAASGTNTGYVTGYLEISKDGTGVNAAKIARYA